MERLTYHDEFDHGMVKFKKMAEGRAIDTNMILDRFAAYEDTGLTPEEISDLVVNYNFARGGYERYHEAEADGRLVVLPCKAGDTVYVIKRVVSNGYPDPIVTKQIFKEKFGYEHLNFPKSIYPTREEAEAALKEVDENGSEK